MNNPKKIDSQATTTVTDAQQKHQEQYVKVLAVKIGQSIEAVGHRAKVVSTDKDGNYVVEFNKKQFVATSVAPVK